MNSKKVKVGSFIKAIFAIICVFITVQLLAEDNYDFYSVAPTGQILYYKISDGYATVVYPHRPSIYYGEDGWTGYEKPEGTMRLPSAVSYGGVDYPVSSIGQNAFQGCNSLHSVNLPTSIIEIGVAAFSGCSGMTDVAIPSSVSFIAAQAFYGCSSLSSVTIPDVVGSIAAESFYGCTGLVSIHFPSSLYEIESSAFYGCVSLSSLSFPEVDDSYFSIGEESFYGCTGLTSIHFSNSLWKIKKSAFYGCTGLTSIEIPESNWSSIVIGEEAFMNCNNLASIVLPDYISSIGKDAFYGTKWYDNQANGVLRMGDWCIGYKGDLIGNSLIIPDGVKYISGKAFYNCANMVAVSIPNSVEQIGTGAFVTCYELASVYIHDIAHWCEIVFYDAYSNPIFYAHNLYVDNVLVTDLVIPNSVSRIGSYAFYNCSCLTSVNIPNSVHSLGQHAFSNCIGLTGISLSNTLSIIENNVFSGCSGLTSVSFPESLMSIGGYAFSNCSGLTSVSFSESMTSIGGSAFRNCSSLVGIYIPNALSSIGDGAFSYCDGLASIIVAAGNPKYDSRNNCAAIVETATNSILVGCKNTIIPNSVTSIGNDAFLGCSDLNSLVIPNSVTRIGNGAFLGCSGLHSLICEALVPPVCDNTYNSLNPYSPFPSNDILLYVPCGKKAAYAEATGWRYLINIIDEESFYDMNVRSGDESLGSVRVVQQPNCENNVATLVAEPIGDHPFLSWMSNGEVVSTANPYTFVVDHEVDLVANFKGMGVEEGEILQVTVSPNPAKDMVLVSCENMSTVVMFAADGRKVKHIEVSNSKEAEIGLFGLSGGLYLIRIETQKGLVINRKIIIQ